MHRRICLRMTGSLCGVAEIDRTLSINCNKNNLKKTQAGFYSWTLAVKDQDRKGGTGDSGGAQDIRGGGDVWGVGVATGSRVGSE